MKEAYTFLRADAFRKLIESKREFARIFEHGTLEIELFKPNGTDTQQPHQKDELYVIISGSATCWHEGSLTEVETGDCIFIPAYDEHCFVKFSDDFSAWVFLFGPEGGEKPA